MVEINNTINFFDIFCLLYNITSFTVVFKHLLFQLQHYKLQWWVCCYLLPSQRFKKWATSVEAMQFLILKNCWVVKKDKMSWTYMTENWSVAIFYFFIVVLVMSLALLILEENKKKGSKNLQTISVDFCIYELYPSILHREHTICTLHYIT